MRRNTHNDDSCANLSNPRSAALRVPERKAQASFRLWRARPRSSTRKTSPTRCGLWRRLACRYRHRWWSACRGTAKEFNPQNIANTLWECLSRRAESTAKEFNPKPSPTSKSTPSLLLQRKIADTVYGIRFSRVPTSASAKTRWGILCRYSVVPALAAPTLLVGTLERIPYALCPQSCAAA